MKIRKQNPTIYTSNGKWLDIFNFKVKDFDEVWMAHSLANINRFNGHTRHAISVAQHSWYVAKLVPEPYKLQALVHDGAEAVIGDVTKWLKHTDEMTPFRELEDKIQRCIFKAVGVPEIQHYLIDEADRLMVRFEGTMGFDKDWKIDHPDYPLPTEEEKRRIGSWDFWSAYYAELMFLHEFYHLTEQKQKMYHTQEKLFDINRYTSGLYRS